MPKLFCNSVTRIQPPPSAPWGRHRACRARGQARRLPHGPDPGPGLTPAARRAARLAVVVRPLRPRRSRVRRRAGGPRVPPALGPVAGPALALGGPLLVIEVG